MTRETAGAARAARLCTAAVRPAWAREPAAVAAAVGIVLDALARHEDRPESVLFSVPEHVPAGWFEAVLQGALADLEQAARNRKESLRLNKVLLFNPEHHSATG